MIIDHPPASLPYTPVKVAFLTGLSNPECCSLSRTYQQFMSELRCPESWKIYLNFPYIPSAEDEEKVSLLNASMSNVRQFLGANSPLYRASAQRHLTSVFASADVLFLVVGSCGLEILNQAWTEAIAPDRVSVVALGPVARQPPAASCLLIQGTHDYISRLFFRTVDVRLPDMGHMDYVTDRRVFDLVSRSLWHRLSTV
ncbi:MAG: hypothetical protein HY785_29350 [Oscillatoriophycideae cyanobacterium NC_groundwater_1537_Pr4_S-0.65um_50_18]|nr:hypothetical protein [Oscillatoriophycideae cyanobacterium NC_groundwater_1537_Pr4_S-0.65um_50_18]